MSGAVVIPVAVTVEGSGGFDTDVVDRIALAGPFAAPLAQVFYGAGVKFQATVTNVYPQWWGARGDYIPATNVGTDSTAAFQAAADAIAAQQVNELAGNRLATVRLAIPQGTYMLTAAVKFHGIYIIQGAGDAWISGSTVIQTTSGANIFEFYGGLPDHSSLSANVDGVNFGFNCSGDGCTGVALYFPKYDDLAPGTILASNSLYFRNIHFGGFYPDGKLISIDHGNDIDISGSTINVNVDCSITLGNGADPDAQVSNVTISENRFYYTYCSLLVENALSVDIIGNSFFNNDFPGIGLAWHAIVLSPCPEGCTPPANYIQGVTIAGNTFNDLPNGILFDASSSGLVITGNTFTRVTNYPIIASQSPAPSGGVNISDNYFGFRSESETAPGYPYYQENSVIDAATAACANWTITDNQVDLSGAPDVLGMVSVGGNVTQTALGAGAVIHGNQFFSGNRAPTDGNYLFQPLTANGLAISDMMALGSTYPADVPVMQFNAGYSSSASFDLSYQVVVQQTGVDTGTVTGTKRVFVAQDSAAGPMRYAISDLGSVSGDDNNSGSNYPIVTFSVDPTSATLQITVSDTLAAPVTGIWLAYTASNFFALGQIAAKAL